jgi:hypothetical protein
MWKNGKPDDRSGESRWLGREAGLTYLGVLILTAMLSTGVAAAGILWHFAQQRERESELLFIGNQFRVAIGRYYLNQLGPQKEYPKRLADLLRDPRHPGTVRYLRRLYADPMTRSTDWGLLRTPDGSILGVYSKSGKAPIKIGHFSGVNRHLERKSKYSEWKFAYLPGQPLGISAAGQTAGQNPSGKALPNLESLAAQPPAPGNFGTSLSANLEGFPKADTLYDNR